MHWYWSSSGTRFADVVTPLLQSMRIRQASPNGIIFSLLACSLLLHLLYACWHGACGPFLQRWQLGVRAPTRQEQQQISEAINMLSSRTSFPILRPRRWATAEGLGLSMRWIGYTLVVDRELFGHRYFLPLLACELYACNSELRAARRLYEMLPPIKTSLSLMGGFAFGIGHVLLYWWWMQYWRKQVHNADNFAVALGQGYALIQVLEELFVKLDVATKGGRKLRQTPYVSQRIDRLRQSLGII